MSVHAYQGADDCILLCSFRNQNNTKKKVRLTYTVTARWAIVHRGSGNEAQCAVFRENGLTSPNVFTRLRAPRRNFRLAEMITRQVRAISAGS